MDPWGKFKAGVLKALREAFSELGWKAPPELEQTLEEPPDPSLGDLASTVCFELARKRHEPPSELARALVGALKPSGLIARAEASRGYVNFFVEPSKLASLTLGAVERDDTRYGCSRVGRGKKVIIEHTSVNPTKPLHIGHGRNAVLGDVLARVLRALGYEVEVHNYIDDLGLQMAQTLLAHREIKRKPRAKFDHMLGLIYVEIQRELERSPELQAEVKRILAELERGEGRAARLARRLAERCVRENLRTTDRLNVSYDLLVWESDLRRSGVLEEVLEKLKRTPYVKEGKGKLAGTLVLKLKDFGLEDKVLVRSDGTAVYTARDIAYQLWKFGLTKAWLRFKPHSRRPDGALTYTSSPRGLAGKRFGGASKVINVVGAEQRFPQQVVFTSLKLLGHEREFKNSYHLAYEHVRLPTERFSGRRGTWVGYSVDEVLEEAVARAYAEVEKRNPKATKRFKQQTAELVGVGAVRFSLVQTSPEKQVVFRWEEALNFEQNSAPAIQYSHARACSILRKARGLEPKGLARLLTLPEERELIKRLAKLPEVVRLAGEKLQPNLLATYAAELALRFNKFYEAAPVLEAETPQLKGARLRLVNCARVVLRNCLELLGISAPERM